ncbi:MAG: ABC transporter ATP-binding protein/permease [Planctomycetes bacterium]|nr:ABC transporter ATP-binding protein/permease [Planctomycetota bacterium]
MFILKRISNDPFWITARVMLGYKRQLAIAAIGLIISTLCFGAGLGLFLPIAKTLLNEQTPRDVLLQWLDHKGAEPATPVIEAAPGTPRPAPRRHNSFVPESVTDAARDTARSLVERIPQDPFLGFVTIVAVIAVLTLIGSAGKYLHEFSTVTIALKSGRVWRQRVFRRLIHAPMEQVLRRGTADEISRLIVDTNQVTTGYQAIFGSVLGDLLKGIVALGMAVAINWRLSLVALAGAPILAVLLRKFAKRIRRATKSALRQRGYMIAGLKEAMGGLAVVKVHDAEGYERRRFSKLNRNLLIEQLRSRQAKAISSPIIETLATLGVMVVACIAAWLIYRSHQPPSDLVSVLVMLGVAAGTLKPVTSLSNTLSEAGAAAERILETTRLPVEPTGLDAPPNLPVLPRHKRDIAVEHVTFHYPGQEAPAIGDVSLHVPFGMTVAVVGANGSGKTTLLSLLVRLFTPTSGRVLIDGADISGVDLRSLRKQIAVVTQQTMLFQGTIADNIAYGRRHEPRERIAAAARAAFADEFIRALPLGYDARLGEDGTGLSGGQKQRIAIARAVLRDAPILILDEATSQVDADSEAKINRAVRELRHGRTTFIIAHRLSTVIDADRIVVMDAGRIIDQGTHTELLARCDIYQLLTQTQLRREVPAAGVKPG